MSPVSAPGVHSELPNDPAERKVAQALIAASSGRWQLWFNLQRNNNEMDDLVLAPDVGSFCIEVKGWTIRSLRDYSDDYVTVGQHQHRHPLKQAQTAMHGLMGHLDDRNIRKGDKPFFYATAALPNIERREMYDVCGDEFSQHFEGMLFAEDLSPDALTRRLLRIGDAPPLGASTTRRVPRPNQTAAVTEILTRKVVLQHKPLASGMTEVFKKIHDAAGQEPSPPKRIGRALTAADRRAALQRPGASLRNGMSRVVFHGKAGTGKTTELLKIALAHALAGRLTLVCCYTKVLAADLRSRMQVLPGFDEVGENLLVVDMGQLGVNSEDSIGFGGFQTICVDEAQDVKQETFDALEALAARDAEWFLSDAPEQALFDQRSAFIDHAVEFARENGTWETKRINLRSGVAERLICDAAIEIAPEVSRIPDWINAHPVGTSALAPSEQEEALEFEVPAQVRGHLPEIVTLPGDTSWASRVAAYERILLDEVDRAARARVPLDLAIIAVRVPDMKGEWKKVKAALDRIGLVYLDQVDVTQRRRSPQAGEVRLATVHSIRGVDADRVILLDIEGMEIVPAESRPTLLNIALSRARHGTVVVLRPIEAGVGTHRVFVEQLVSAYRCQAIG